MEKKTKLIKSNGTLYLVKPNGERCHLSRDNAYNWLIAQFPTTVTLGQCLAIDSDSDGVIADA